MVRTASTGADVDRNGDVPEDHRVWDVRRGRAAGAYAWQLHPQYDGNTPTGRARSPSNRRRPSCRPTRFFWAGIAAIGASATLQMMGKQSASVFVGQWAAPRLLILGLYNKLVKQHGSDFTDMRA